MTSLTCSISPCTCLILSAFGLVEKYSCNWSNTNQLQPSFSSFSSFLRYGHPVVFPFMQGTKKNPLSSSSHSLRSCLSLTLSLFLLLLLLPSVWQWSLRTRSCHRVRPSWGRVRGCSRPRSAPWCPAKTQRECGDQNCRRPYTCRSIHPHRCSGRDI